MKYNYDLNGQNFTFRSHDKASKNKRGFFDSIDTLCACLVLLPVSIGLDVTMFNQFIPQIMQATTIFDKIFNYSIGAFMGFSALAFTTATAYGTARCTIEMIKSKKSEKDMKKELVYFENSYKLKEITNNLISNEMINNPKFSKEITNNLKSINQTLEEKINDLFLSVEINYMFLEELTNNLSRNNPNLKKIIDELKKDREVIDELKVEINNPNLEKMLNNLYSEEFISNLNVNNQKTIEETIENLKKEVEKLNEVKEDIDDPNIEIKINDLILEEIINRQKTDYALINEISRLNTKKIFKNKLLEEMTNDPNFLSKIALSNDSEEFDNFVERAQLQDVVNVEKKVNLFKGVKEKAPVLNADTLDKFSLRDLKKIKSNLEKYEKCEDYLTKNNYSLEELKKLTNKQTAINNQKEEDYEEESLNYEDSLGSIGESTIDPVVKSRNR